MVVRSWDRPVVVVGGLVPGRVAGGCRRDHVDSAVELSEGLVECCVGTGDRIGHRPVEPRRVAGQLLVGAVADGDDQVATGAFLDGEETRPGPTEVEPGPTSCGDGPRMDLLGRIGARRAGETAGAGGPQ